MASCRSDQYLNAIDEVAVLTFVLIFVFRAIRPESVYHNVSEERHGAHVKVTNQGMIMEDNKKTNTTPTDAAPTGSRFWYDSKTDGPMCFVGIVNRKTGIKTLPDGTTLPAGTPWPKKKRTDPGTEKAK